MNQIVKSFMEKHQLIEDNNHIIVAVSGGPDSMALLHYLMVQEDWCVHLSVAHVEHGLRGESSLEDMSLVESFCEKQQIPFYYHQPDVKRVMAEKGYSLQEAARFCRYSWLEELMTKLMATSIALAHHGDDQIETMLMKLVRGGLTSLQGIPVKRPFASGNIIRPFLGLEKKDILDYCKINNVPYRIDETNEKDTYQRNRFRKSILPFLKEENTNVHQIFQRQSEWLREENDFLQKEAELSINKAIITREEGRLKLCNKRFLDIPIPLQRRGLHLILNYLSVDVGRHITSSHIDEIISLIKNKSPSKEIHLPKKIIVRKAYDNCYFLLNREKEEGFPPIMLPLTGIVTLKQGKITAETVQTSLPLKKDVSVFIGDKEKLSLPLFVRSRQVGDRITLLGMDGSKKVKKIFIEEKIPKPERESWPIVTDNNDNILWIPLLKRGNTAIVDESTKEAVMLIFEKSK